RRATRPDRMHGRAGVIALRHGETRSCRVGKGARAPCPPSLGSEVNGGHAAPCPPYNFWFPNFSCSAGNSRSGLNGTDVKRMPVASASALPSAAATGLYGLSRIDLAPIGPMLAGV